MTCHFVTIEIFSDNVNQQEKEREFEIELKIKDTEEEKDELRETEKKEDHLIYFLFSINSILFIIASTINEIKIFI
jgi:hypothetical protein